MEATKSILLVVSPGLHRKLKAIAKREGISVRALCRRALEGAVQP